jgi:hypothetical protein
MREKMARKGRIGAPASRAESRPRQIPWRMRIDEGAAYNGAGGVDLALKHAPRRPLVKGRHSRLLARGGGGGAPVKILGLAPRLNRP